MGLTWVSYTSSWETPLPIILRVCVGRWGWKVGEGGGGVVRREIWGEWLGTIKTARVNSNCPRQPNKTKITATEHICQQITPTSSSVPRTFWFAGWLEGGLGRPIPSSHLSVSATAGSLRPGAKQLLYDWLSSDHQSIQRHQNKKMNYYGTEFYYIYLHCFTKETNRRDGKEKRVGLQKAI